MPNPAQAKPGSSSEQPMTQQATGKVRTVCRKLPTTGSPKRESELQPRDSCGILGFGELPQILHVYCFYRCLTMSRQILLVLVFRGNELGEHNLAQPGRNPGKARAPEGPGRREQAGSRLQLAGVNLQGPAAWIPQENATATSHQGDKLLETFKTPSYK